MITPILWLRWLACAIALASVCHASTPAYVDDFPSVDRVLQEIRGRDDRDTQARQVGALSQLWAAVASLAGQRRETADETRLRQSYNLAIGRINIPMMATFNQAETDRLGFRSPRAKWVALCSMYEHDEDLRAFIFARFFTPEFVRRYGPAIREGHRVQKHSEEELRQEDHGALMQTIEDLPWYKGPAFSLAVVSGLIFTWFFLSFWREFRRFGLDPSDAHRLLAGGRRYVLSPVTGVVVDERKQAFEKITTRKWKDESVPGRERTETVVEKSLSHRFNIATPDGGKTLVWLDHHHAHLSEGMRASAIRVARTEKKFGDYLFFIDHEGGVRSRDTSRTRKLFRLRYGLFVSGVAALICVGLYARAARDYPLNRANFPTLFDYTGFVAHGWLETVPNWIVQYWARGLGAFLLFWLLARLIGDLRSRVFLRHGCAALAAELDAEARRQVAAGFDASHTPREKT